MNYFTLNKTNVNLTGSQIAKILDSITNQILYSLNMFTSVLDINLVSMLSWVSNNRRKKISYHIKRADLGTIKFKET